MKILKILIPTIIFFSYSFNSFAENEQKECTLFDTGTGYKKKEKWVNLWGIENKWVEKEYYENGKLKSEGNMTGGGSWSKKPIGYWKYY